MKNLGYTILLALIGITGCKKSENIININQPIRHDDFEYSVTAVEKRKSIISDHVALNAKGTFWIVTFRVQNNALRVGHKWDNQIAYVITEDGRSYKNEAYAKQILNDVEPFHLQQNYLTPHGEIETTKLIFDIPEDIIHTYLKVEGTMFMGDVGNFNRFKRMRIKLF